MRGPLQNIGGSDGIGDDPFWLDPNSIDNYPLMQPIPEFDGLLPPAAVVFGIILFARIRHARKR
jgi:hypothetical protein